LVWWTHRSPDGTLSIGFARAGSMKPWKAGLDAAGWRLWPGVRHA
jgi:hypothetical protein